jgi:L-serine dehydratase
MARPASSRPCCTTTTASAAGASDEGVCDFLLTAGAIGILYKENASISGAEVGCQGEVGVACSMAAARLWPPCWAAAPAQVENAAEIGMEHNLGLTCDPDRRPGADPLHRAQRHGRGQGHQRRRMALRGDGKHKVSLDKVIKTMRDTGATCRTSTRKPRAAGWR